MPVTHEQAGLYRQITAGLRFRRGADEIESLRPRVNGNDKAPFTDEPTLIEFREGDPVDVDSLITTGAIEPTTEETITDGAEKVVADDAELLF